jgi:ribosomal protein L37AE/L43A
MDQFQRTQTTTVRTEQPHGIKCRHLHRKYVINEIEYKMWRCEDCGLIQREEE